MSHATSTLRLYHEAALDSLHALVRLQDLVLRYAQLPCEQRSVLRIETLCQESLVSFMQGLQKIAENPERTYSIERMTAARLALGRDLLKFRNIQAPSAHELVFAASIFFVRLWNRRARPAAFDIPPLTGSGSWQFVLYAPQEEMDLGRFLDEAHQCA